MRDTGTISGPKRYYSDLEDAIIAVRAVYPTATRQGSVGAWSWRLNEYSDDELIVAEAWLHSFKPGWWLKIARNR